VQLQDLSLVLQAILCCLAVQSLRPESGWDSGQLQALALIAGETLEVERVQRSGS